jgi:hypothetical protein
MSHLKMVRSVHRIQKYRSKNDKYKNGSLTVVAVIFVGVLLSCLIFQLAAYNQELGSIQQITEQERMMRQRVVKAKHHKHVHFKRTSGHK